MAYKESTYTDKEHFLMMELTENKQITQRELSNKLNISLGSINILINKMVKDGLVKVRKVSKNQILYILTPAGVLEKTRKTVNYLKFYYSVINNTKDNIKVFLSKLTATYEQIAVVLSEDEMGKIVQSAIAEFESANNLHGFVKVFFSIDDFCLQGLDPTGAVVVVVDYDDKTDGRLYEFETVCLMESI